MMKLSQMLFKYYKKIKGYLVLYWKRSDGFIVVLHMVVLTLYFTNSFSLPYVFFDTIWWTMIGAGIICCINLFKEKSKWLFLLVPSTFIFIQILPITLLLNDM